MREKAAVNEIIKGYFTMLIFFYKVAGVVQQQNLPLKAYYIHIDG